MSVRKINYYVVLVMAVISFSCNQVQPEFIPESISVKLNNGDSLKVFKYKGFVELSPSRYFFYNLDEEKGNYETLMDELQSKKWNNNFIYIEYENYLNDSIFQEFKKLNESIFNDKIKKMYVEEPLIVIDFTE